MPNVIQVQNLKKTYKLAKGKELEAVRGIGFEVFKGEIFGILGPNGAGKTTTLEIIECLKPQTDGVVTVLEFDNLKSPDEIKKRIGVQLQSSQYLHHLSLGELLDLFASLYPRTEAEPLPLSGGSTSRLARRSLGEVGSEGRGLDINQPTPTTPSRQSGTPLLKKEGNAPRLSFDSRMGKKTELLKLVGLEDKIHEEFANLSGGQKQRFTIATSLVHEPQILFLDEPTTGLDPKARRDMWGLIKTINARGITIVLTTHYMEEAEFLCHRVAIMDEGKILEIDEPKKLIDRLSDTTQISFFTDTKIDPKLFSGISEVKKVHAAYPKVVLEITSLDKISAVVNLLRQHQIIFYGFTVKTAALEDVYLDLTGRAYDEGENDE